MRCSEVALTSFGTMSFKANESGKKSKPKITPAHIKEPDTFLSGSDFTEIITGCRQSVSF